MTDNVPHRQNLPQMKLEARLQRLHSANDVAVPDGICLVNVRDSNNSLVLNKEPNRISFTTLTNFGVLLWLFMAALCNRGAIIFLPCDFYLISSSIFFFFFFFPRLISAATDWMSTILLHMAWP